MATSKASMLKKAANKTGKGLFAGMTMLEAGEDVPQAENKITSDSPRMTEEVKKEREVVPSEIDKEPVSTIQETITVKEEQAEPERLENAETVAQRVEINEEINKQANEPKTQREKGTNSRYEKEKFLLLDIRGYRDYIEHMAKAANMSATKYIRNLIQLDMDKNMDIYEAHKALEEKLRGRTGN